MYIALTSDLLKITKEKIRGLELWTRLYGNENPRLVNGVDINKLWPAVIPLFADIIYFVGFLTKIPLKKYDMTYRSKKYNYEWKDLKEDNKLISIKLRDDLYVHYMDTYLTAVGDVGYYFNLNMDNIDVVKYYVLWGFGPTYDPILPELKDDKYHSEYIDRTQDLVDIAVVDGEKINITDVIDNDILLSISFPADDDIDHIEFGTHHKSQYLYTTTYDNDYLKYIDKIICPRDDNGYSISFTNGVVGYYSIVEETYMTVHYKNKVESKEVPFIFNTCSSIE